MLSTFYLCMELIIQTHCQIIYIYMHIFLLLCCYNEIFTDLIDKESSWYFFLKKKHENKREMRMSISGVAGNRAEYLLPSEKNGVPQNDDIFRVIQDLCELNTFSRFSHASTQLPKNSEYGNELSETFIRFAFTFSICDALRIFLASLTDIPLPNTVSPMIGAGANSLWRQLCRCCLWVSPGASLQWGETGNLGTMPDWSGTPLVGGGKTAREILRRWNSLPAHSKAWWLVVA